MRSNLAIVLILGSLATSAAPAPTELASKYCNTITLVTPHTPEGIETRNRDACIAGVKIADKYQADWDRIDQFFVKDMCKQESQQPLLCEKGIWAFFRFKNGVSSTFTEAQALCKKEYPEFNPYPAANACAYGAEVIEYNIKKYPDYNLNPTYLYANCSAYLTVPGCAFSIWAYRRIVRGTTSSRYKKTIRYCEQKTGLVRYAKKVSENAHQCFYGADFMEEYPNTTDERILFGCRGFPKPHTPTSPNPFCEAAAKFFKSAI